MKKYNIKSIAPYLEKGFVVKGEPEKLCFTNVKPVDYANENSLIWISPSNPEKQEIAEKTKANVIICDQSIDTDHIYSKKFFIVVNNPKLVFSRIIKALFLKKNRNGIHPTAIIHSEAKIGENVFIGLNTYIGKSQIGDNTIIYGNCYIYDDVSIDKNVKIHAGTVIGADGFGYIKNEKGEMELFPHIGGVVIESYVDIGSNTSIDRGSLGNTIIKQGAKIDNLVHIAHNVVIGRNTIVIAHAMIGGSTFIGDNSWIAPSASIKDGLTIGSNVTIGMGAVVIRDVPSNETWAGVPAKKLEHK